MCPSCDMTPSPLNQTLPFFRKKKRGNEIEKMKRGKRKEENNKSEGNRKGKMEDIY
jgi:hypothetical protein